MALPISKGRINKDSLYVDIFKDFKAAGKITGRRPKEMLKLGKEEAERKKKKEKKKRRSVKPRIRGWVRCCLWFDVWFWFWLGCVSCFVVSIPPGPGGGADELKTGAVSVIPSLAYASSYLV